MEAEFKVPKDQLDSLFIDQEIMTTMQCPIHKGVLQDPVLDPCGHTFCSICIKDAIKSDGLCPVSRAPLKEESLSRNLALLGVLNSLQVVCLQKPQGCAWQQKYDRLIPHITSECEYFELKCPNPGCQEKLPRKSLKAHSVETCEHRLLACEYCQLLVASKDLQGHIENCPQKPSPCQNGCGSSIPRQLMGKHLEQECPLERIRCPYHYVGCTEQCQRKNMPDHLEVAQVRHQTKLPLLFDSLALVDQRTSQADKQIQELKQVLLDTTSKWELAKAGGLPAKAQPGQQMNQIPFPCFNPPDLRQSITLENENRTAKKILPTPKAPKIALGLPDLSRVGASFSWKVRVDELVGDIAVGIASKMGSRLCFCDFHADPGKRAMASAVFLFNTGAVHNTTETIPNTNLAFQKGDIIEICFNKLHQSLEWRLRGISYKIAINNVKKTEDFVPCVLFQAVGNVLTFLP